MKSYILVTNNSEKYIYDVLCSLLPLKDDEELIIFDNHSKDNTVPIVINAIGINWIDPKYRFYINSKKETVKSTKEKALSIAKYDPIIINKRTKFKLEE